MPAVLRKAFASADIGTIYTFYLSLCTQSADGWCERFSRDGLFKYKFLSHINICLIYIHICLCLFCLIPNFAIISIGLQYIYIYPSCLNVYEWNFAAISNIHELYLGVKTFYRFLCSFVAIFSSTFYSF